MHQVKSSNDSVRPAMAPKSKVNPLSRSMNMLEQAFPGSMNAILEKMAADRGPDTPLHHAAHSGDYVKLKALIKQSDMQSSLNDKNWLGCTPLRLAASVGADTCVEILIQHGADVNKSDIKAQTPLLVAVKKHHTGCVKRLLQAGALPSGDSQNLCTPIYVAAMEGFYDAVKELVIHGADLNCTELNMGSFASTPLYITIAYHHWDCFCLLLLSGADPDYHCQTTNRGLAPHNTYETLYHTAVRHKSPLKYTQLLYEVGASLTFKDDKSRLATELDVHNDIQQETVCFLQQCLSNPRSLKSCCRIVVGRTIDKKHRENTKHLPLPSELISYLNYDII